MTETPHKKEKKTRGLFSSIFPREYDFCAMLESQADRTVAGVLAFTHWLDAEPRDNPAELARIENEVDLMRHVMEEHLIASFSTPFDRQDIYSISRQID